MLLNYDGSIEHHKLSLKIVQNLEKAWVLIDNMHWIQFVSISLKQQ